MKRIAVLGALVATVLAAPALLAAEHDRDDQNHRDQPRTAHQDNDRGQRGDSGRDNRGSQDRNHGSDARADHGRDDRRDNGRDDHRDYGRDHGGYDRNAHANDRRADDRGYGSYRNYGRYQPPRGYVEHRWRRGERLPVAYYQRPYVVDTYRDYGLRIPPRGYHWVRVNGDAVLAAITTGLVLDTIFHVFG